MSNVIMCSECKKCDGDRCNYFDNDSDRESTIACILFEPKNPTVFQQITASPEVLAPKFVYHITSFLDGLDKPKKIWYSTLINNQYFSTELEAKRATVAKLKGVAE